MSEIDWTMDEEGRTNNSPEYLKLVEVVDRLIRSGASSLLAGRADVVARTIVSHLAHEYGLRPVGVVRQVAGG